MSTDLLVLRALGLGDTLAAVPALRALRRSVDGRITFAGPAQPGQLLVDNGIVDDVLPTSGLRADGMPRGASVAVNLHGKGPQSHQLLLATSPRRIVAFACGQLGVDGPPWRDDEPERARWCRLVGDTWGTYGDPDDVRLDASSREAPLPTDVVVHPGAAHASRRWPVDRWAAVVAHLAREHRVTITGSQHERAAAIVVADRAGLREQRVLAGVTSVPELTGLVASARLVVSGDTGIAHLAYACGTPSITLFGPTSPALWGPPTTGPHLALWHGAGDGDPHADTPDRALLSISPAEVVAACEDVLERHAAGR